MILFARCLSSILTYFIGMNLPVVIVVAVSLVIGLLMVVVFRYTSDQKAIRMAKDQLKAHLLAVRLFQDQLPVVLASYVRIIRGTGRYLRLALKPLLIVILPLIILIVQLDRYLGFAPIKIGQPFLVTVHAERPEVLDALALIPPPGIETTAPPVHVPSDNEVIWRVIAQRRGIYDLAVAGGQQTISKRVVVSSELARLSRVRLRGRLWERFFLSGEPALPGSSLIQSVAVNYPDRTINFAGMEWSWIWLFFVLSLLAGFFFKTVLRIEI